MSANSGTSGSAGMNSTTGTGTSHAMTGTGMNSTDTDMDNDDQTSGRRRHSSNARHSARSSSDDTSQNAEIDRLNEQSLQAAQQGRPFRMGSTGNSGAGMSSSGASMNSGMSGSSSQWNSSSSNQPGQPQHFRSDASSGAVPSGQVTSYGSPNSYHGGRTATSGTPR